MKPAIVDSDPGVTKGTARYAAQVVLAVEQYDDAGRLVDAKQSQPTTLAVLSVDALTEAWAGLLDQLMGAVNGGRA